MRLTTALGATLFAMLFRGAMAQTPSPAADARATTSAMTAMPAAAEDPAHNELRTLRDAMIAAVNKHDIDAVLKFVHPNAVFTPLDAQVCHGTDQIRAYMNKMLTGPESIVRDMSVKLTVDDLAALYHGDTAVAWGSIDEHFDLRAGMEFDSHDRWSATLVKDNGHWLVVNFHTSSNLFDNPLLNVAKHGATVAGAMAGVVGIILGLLIGRMKKRKPVPAAAASAAKG